MREREISLESWSGSLASVRAHRRRLRPRDVGVTEHQNGATVPFGSVSPRPFSFSRNDFSSHRCIRRKWGSPNFGFGGSIDQIRSDHFVHNFKLSLTNTSPMYVLLYLQLSCTMAIHGGKLRTSSHSQKQLQSSRVPNSLRGALGSQEVVGEEVLLLRASPESL